MTKRRELTETEKKWAANLMKIWQAHKARTGMSQEALAEQLKMTQPAVGQYLNAKLPLNTDAMCLFAKVLGVDVTEIDNTFYERLGLSDSRAAGASDIPSVDDLLALGEKMDAEALGAMEVAIKDVETALNHQDSIHKTASDRLRKALDAFKKLLPTDGPNARH